MLYKIWKNVFEGHKLVKVYENASSLFKKKAELYMNKRSNFLSKKRKIVWCLDL